MTLQLYSQLKLSLICVFFLCKYGPNLSQRNLNVLCHTQVLSLNIYSVKGPNNNLSVNPTFLSNAPTLQSLIFILSKQVLKIKAFTHFPFSANTCISSTCCTIMGIHERRNIDLARINAIEMPVWPTLGIMSIGHNISDARILIPLGGLGGHYSNQGNQSDHENWMLGDPCIGGVSVVVVL